MLPSVGTQSLIANSTVTRSQVPTNSSIIETHPGTATNKSVTTCNKDKDVVTHCEAVMVCTEEEIIYKPSLHSSSINSDTDTTNKRELICNVSRIFQEDLIPNELSIPHKETQEEQSQMDLLHINLSDLDMEYWSNFSLKDMGILEEDLFDHPASTYCPASTHLQVDA